MYGYIYKTTNMINNKIYIGQKKSNYFLENNYLGSGKYLKNAIKKYGIENFIVELLDTADTKDDLNILEKFYIQKFNSINKDIDYNIAKGAVGGDTYSGLSNEDKEARNAKLRQYHKLSKKNNIKYVYLHKEDVTKRVKLADINQYLLNGWEKGRSKSFEEALRQGHIGLIHSKEWGNNISKGWKNRTLEQKQQTKEKHSIAATKQMQLLSKEERKLKASLAGKSTNSVKRMWVHKDDIQKFINADNLADYIKEGYKKGFNENTCKHMSNSQKGKFKPKDFVYVYKDTNCKRISKNELDIYINLGWQKGNLYLRGVKKSAKKL